MLACVLVSRLLIYETHLAGSDPILLISARTNVNITKNRYSNILPFDHSRVRLTAEDDSMERSIYAQDEMYTCYSGTDYINANYLMVS